MNGRKKERSMFGNSWIVREVIKGGISLSGRTGRNRLNDYLCCSHWNQTRAIVQWILISIERFFQSLDVIQKKRS